MESVNSANTFTYYEGLPPELKLHVLTFTKDLGNFRQTSLVARDVTDVKLHTLWKNWENTLSNETPIKNHMIHYDPASKELPFSRLQNHQLMEVFYDTRSEADTVPIEIKKAYGTIHDFNNLAKSLNKEWQEVKDFVPKGMAERIESHLKNLSVEDAIPLLQDAILSVNGNDESLLVFFNAIENELLKLNEIDPSKLPCTTKEIKEWLKQPDTKSLLSKITSLSIAPNDDYTKLKALPIEITLLTNLRSLHLINCKLKDIPREIANLDKLEEVNLSNNKLTEIPDVLFSCPKLKSVDISFNDIAAIPSKIRHLKKLEKFNFDNTNIQQIPAEIEFLTHLRELKANGLPLPPSLAALTSTPTQPTNFWQKVKAIPAAEIAAFGLLTTVSLTSAVYSASMHYDNYQIYQSFPSWAMHSVIPSALGTLTSLAGLGAAILLKNRL